MLVTGASRGLGRAIALELARAGFALTLPEAVAGLVGFLFSERAAYITGQVLVSTAA